MKQKTNRLIATVLAIVMLVGLLPLTAFAADPVVIESFDITWSDFDNPTAGETTYRARTGLSYDSRITLDLADSSSFWLYDGTGKNTNFNYKFEDLNNGTKVFAEGTVYCLMLRVSPNDGYSLSAANASSYLFNGVAPSKVDDWAPVLRLYYQFPITSLVKQPTPTATFSANGYDSGTLSSVKSGMKYSLDGGLTWTLIEGTSVSIASGVTPENDIKVYAPGVAEESTDSDIQTIDITRSVVTGVTVQQPTTIGGEGTILGMDNTMRYKWEGDAYWTSGVSPHNVVAPRTVLVRVEASGTALESEVASFTVNAFEAGKAATPTEVSFNATDDDKGVLTGVSAGLRYRVNSGAWQAITSTDDVLLTSLAAGDVITVWRLGNGTTTVDSDPVTFTLTQAATPTGVLNVNPTTAENNDGKLIGVDSTMEYKRASDAAWTAITGTEVTGLVPDTYYIRVKGSGTVLASGYISVTVSAITQALQPRFMSFTATGSDSGTLAQSGAGTGTMLNGEVFYWYTSLDATRHEFTYADTAPTLTGLTGACTLYVVRKGVVGSTYDSIPREVTVGKETRTVTAENITLPATAAAQGSIALGSQMEVWSEDEGRWMDGVDYKPSYSFNFNVGDAVTVRYKATGNQLAGDSFHFVAVTSDKAESIKISATLSESFKMNYYITLSEAEAAEAKIKFTFNGVSKTVTGEKQGETDEYKFVFAGIAPQQMGDTISAKLVLGDLEVGEKSCTMKEYLTALRSEISEYYHSEYSKYLAISGLIDSVLTYGAAAQLYANYKTESLVVNASVLDGLTFPSGTDYSRTNGTYATFVSASMNFNSLSRLKIKFTAEDTSELVVKYKIGTGEEKVLPYVSDGAGNYVVTTPGIAALDYGKVYTFTVYKGGVEDATLTYSVKSYAYSMSGSENENMRNLAKAAYNYGESARSYAVSFGT